MQHRSLYNFFKNHLGKRLSSPIFALQLPIDPWCNGNTTDFGSVIYGSNPYGSTKPCLASGESGAFYLRLAKQVVKLSFQSFNSIPKAF